MPDGHWVISPTGSYASGTYYGTYTGTFTGTFIYEDFRVDVRMSGTCWEIHADVAEIEEVAQVTAYEGQWFIKANDNNILVADVELMPVRRNSMVYEWSSGLQDIAVEFPFHYRAPETIEGNVELIFDSGASSRCCGCVIYGDYIFTRRISNGTVVKINRKTTVEDAWGGPPVPGYNTSFSVIDQDHVVVYAIGEAWYMMDWTDYTIRQIASVPVSIYYMPHWAVIKDVLCIGMVYETANDVPSPSYTNRWYGNWMFNIWTGEQLFGQITPSAPADAFVENTFFSDLVVERSFFWCVAKTSENGGTWPEVVGPEPAMIYRLTAYPDFTQYGPIQDFMYEAKVVKLYFHPEVPYGDLEVAEMAYNPADKMIYINAVYYGGDSDPQDYELILRMSPENLSYSIVHQIPLGHVMPPFPIGEVIGSFMKARDDVYVLLRSSDTSYPFADCYNVRNLSTPLWSAPIYRNIGYLDTGSLIVDDYDRLWTMGHEFLGEQLLLYAWNIKTGALEYSIDTGIPYPWGDHYYYPTTFPYRTLIVADDSILVFSHNTIQYAYRGYPYISAQNTYIYKVT